MPRSWSFPKLQGTRDDMMVVGLLASITSWFIVSVRFIHSVLVPMPRESDIREMVETGDAQIT